MSIGMRCSVPPYPIRLLCGLVTMECIPEYMHYVGKGKDKEEVRGELMGHSISRELYRPQLEAKGQ